MKTIPNFPNYAITKDGRVWSKKRVTLSHYSVKGKWLKPRQTTAGYCEAVLFCVGKEYKKAVHRLVLETYVGPCPPGMECRHLDGNSLNNRLNNLKWGTHQENVQDAIKQKTFAMGENHFYAKLKASDVRIIIYVALTGLFTHQEIADQYGVQQSCISRILQRKRWGHIWAR